MKYAFCLLGILSVCFSTLLAWENHRIALQKEYGSDPFVTLSGTWKLKVFPGPPEYSSIENGDREDLCWVLDLDKESFTKEIGRFRNFHWNSLLLLPFFMKH